MTRTYLTSILEEVKARVGSIKIAIVAPVGNITTRKGSHKAAWAKIIRVQLSQMGYDVEIVTKKETWDSYNVILLEHGMEFKGSYNIFGGATDELAADLLRITTAYGQGKTLISCDWPMPDIGEWIQKRQGNCEPKFKELDYSYFTAVCGQINGYDRTTMSGGICIGDSHILSQWMPGWEILRMDGKTLHGALEMGLDTLVDDHHQTALFYFGNIDIRHHILRQSDPATAIQTLVWNYVTQLYALRQRMGSVYVVHALPIEDESRKLAKVGYYKDTPFYGSWDHRNWARTCFNELLNSWAPQYSIEVIPHPETFVGTDGRLKFDVMEPSKGVHISPEHYRTNLEDGRVRW